MDRRKAILKAARVTIVGLGILIILLLVEAFYFNWSHGIYALVGAIGLKFLIARNFTEAMKKIDRDYPKEEENSSGKA